MHKIYIAILPCDDVRDVNETRHYDTEAEAETRGFKTKAKTET